MTEGERKSRIAGDGNVPTGWLFTFHQLQFWFHWQMGWLLAQLLLTDFYSFATAWERCGLLYTGC